MTDYIVTQDNSSGRVHKRYRTESGYATHEADNLDQAGVYTVVNSADYNEISDDLWCQRCFPDGAAPVPEDDGSTWTDT